MPPRKFTVFICVMPFCIGSFLIILKSIHYHTTSLQIMKSLPSPAELSNDRYDASMGWPEGTLSMCNATRTTTRFAIVSMLSIYGDDDTKHYITGLSKIGSSVRLQSNIDMVLMTIGTLSMHDEDILKRTGWSICPVPVIESPFTTQTNRYLKNKMYSKLNIWRLEYECILYVDADVLFIRSFRPVFEKIYPHMLNANKTLAMTWDCMDPSETTSVHMFNAGVILATPSIREYEKLVHAAQTMQHEHEFAEQAFLNTYYRGRIFPLSPIYNAMVSWQTRKLEKTWKSIEDSIVVLHFIYKPWAQINCWFYNVDEWCLLWHSFSISDVTATIPTL